MAGYFIAEEGPLSGQTFSFTDGNEWVLGRDPDVVNQVLEDPMVSRRHVILRLSPEGYMLQNLSSVNPATQNGRVITEPVLLREGDIVQIGNTFFRFTEKNPSEQVELQPPRAAYEEIEPMPQTRWLLKVVSGPNAGAEFGMQKSSTYILGKDPTLCDLVFQDLSVSRQHARISVDENNNVFIEDLKSRNGTLVNGVQIQDRRQLHSQDVVALGTTTFMVVDRDLAQETIFSPTPPAAEMATPEKEETAPAIKEVRNWKEMIIPTKHIVVVGVLAVFVLFVGMGMLSLFKSETVVVAQKKEHEHIAEAIKKYHDVQFTFNEVNGKLFLVGHVLTPVEHQELMYVIRNLPFVRSLEDNVVIDEYVWQNMNDLLTTNSAWQGVSIHSPKPGHFVIRGYLQNLEQAQALTDYLNLNFPYLDRLENQVAVEANLQAQVESQLIEKGFSGVSFQLIDGELVLTGRVDSKMSHSFNEALGHFKKIVGIRSVKNFVVLSSAETARIDVSDKYPVAGYSKKDEKNFYVVIGGRILSKGDTLDGMTITAVQPSLVLLEKDGLKFKINYNLQ